MGLRRRGFARSKWGARIKEVSSPRRHGDTEKTKKLMLTQDRAADIFDRIQKFSSADEVEVLFSGGKFALTRFANNTIHQNVAEENYGVSVRTAFGRRTARASTNKLDD